MHSIIIHAMLNIEETMLILITFNSILIILVYNNCILCIIIVYFFVEVTFAYAGQTELFQHIDFGIDLSTRSELIIQYILNPMLYNPYTKH